MKTLKNFLNPVILVLTGLTFAISTSCSSKVDQGGSTPEIDGSAVLNFPSISIDGDGDALIDINDTPENAEPNDQGSSDGLETVSGGMATTKATLRRSNTSTTKTISRMLSPEGQVSEWSKLDEFDVMTSMESSATNDVQDTAIGKRSASLEATLRRAALMPVGTRYRILIYDANLRNQLVNTEVASGTNPNIRLNAEATYRWFAFSLNESSTVPNINAQGVVDRAQLINKDFLFAQGTITPVLGENNMNIVLARQTTRVEVEINTRGLFGPINDNSSISLGYLSGTSFNNLVETGNFSVVSSTPGFSNQQVAPVALSGDDLVPTETATGDYVRRAAFHTARTTNIPANNLVLRLNALNITLDDDQIRSFTANTLVPIRNSSTLSMQRGTRSRAQVRLIESGITVGGIEWARTNLIYENGQAVDKWRFRPNNNYAVGAAEEFWNFGTNTPTGSFQPVNVCRSVYPSGTWTLPSPDNIITLGGRPRSRTRQSVSGGNRYALEWNPDAGSSTNPAYPDNRLILAYLGYRRTNNGSLTAQPHASGTGELHYWTNTYTTGGATTAQHSFASVSNGTFNSNSENLRTSERREGRNIRCIRAIVNN